MGEAIRRGREPQEKTRMGRMVMERREKPRRTKRNLRKRMGAEMARARKTAIGQERRMTPRRRRMVRVAKRRGREPQEKTRMGRMVMNRNNKNNKNKPKKQKKRNGG